MATIWKGIIKKDTGCKTKINSVCEKYFFPRDILETYRGAEVPNVKCIIKNNYEWIFVIVSGWKHFLKGPL